jgi:hypothetical protein
VNGQVGEHILLLLGDLGPQKVDEQNCGDESNCGESFKSAEGVLGSSLMVLRANHLLVLRAVEMNRVVVLDVIF